jgi:hypothetical protein
MATHSLSTDEFGTVGSFSAKGPVHVMTDYRAPKNHIFFNLLNSILPARESLSPARVRALSIAAVALTAIVLVAWGAWRGRLLEISVLLALWSTAPQMLLLSMEARGYGFLGLFAVLSSLAVIEQLRVPSLHWLAILGVSVALGTWTVPGFLFFGGPLMLLLWAVQRTRAAFLAGLLTFAAILALHAPVLVQLFAAFTGFHQDKAEADFVAIGAVLRAMKLYLFQADDWESWTLCLLLALAPFAMPGKREDAALRVLVLAVLAYFAVLFILRTPPIRVAAFALLPLALAGFLALGGWLRTHAPPALRVTAVAFVGICLLAQLAGAARTFTFTPTEDWSLAGRAIDAAFPPATRIDFKRYAKYLGKTLADPKARESAFDDAAFAEGRLVVADAPNKWAGSERFTPPTNVPGVVRWTIPGTIRDIVLTFRRPEAAGLAGLPSALTDGRTETGFPLDGLTLRADRDARTVVVLLDRPARAGEIDLPSGSFIAGNALVIPPARDELHLRAPQGNLRATEAWLVP